MTHRVIFPVLGALGWLLADAGFPQQVVSPIGRKTTSTVKIEGCKGQAGCNPVPVDIGGTSVSATTTCHATAAAPTYVEGSDDPVSCDLSGGVRTSGGGGGSSDVAVHDNATPSRHLVVDASGQIGVTGTFWQATQPVSGTVAATQSGTWTVQPGNTANTTAWKVDGSAVTQPVSGTFWQATQPVSGAVAVSSLPNSPSQEHITAISYNSSRLTDGAAFYDATKTGQLPAALDASGGVKVHEVGVGHVICDSGCAAGASFIDNSAFTASSTAVNVAAGVFNDGLADVMSGNAAAPRITAKRAEHVNLRNTAGTEVGTVAAPLAVQDQPADTTSTNSGAAMSVACTDANINACGANSTLELATAGFMGASATITTSSTLVGDVVADCTAGGTATWRRADFETADTALHEEKISLTSGVGFERSVAGCTGAGKVRLRLRVVTSGNVPTSAALLRGAMMQVPQWIRTSAIPIQKMLGCYSLAANSAVYTGLVANDVVFSARWGAAAPNIAIIGRVSVTVTTTTAATAVGRVDREMVVARSFSTSDSGQTAITLTGNAFKLKTIFPSTLFTSMQITNGGAITAGTRTLDTRAIGSAMFTMGTNAVTALTQAIVPKTNVFSAMESGGVVHPLVLVTNEGFVIRMATAQPASSSFITTVEMVWCEATSYP